MIITNFSTWEIIVYSLINFLPYLFLVLFPFKDSFRYSTIITVILAILLSFIQIGMGIWATLFRPSNIGIISMSCVIIYATFFLVAVKTSFGKMAFVLFIICNYAHFVVISSKYFERLFFPNLAMQTYRWSFSLTMLLVQMITLPWLSWFFNSKIRPVVNHHSIRNIWWYLWLIPATFYMTGYYGIYMADQATPNVQLATRLDNVLFLLFINLGALLVYYMVVLLINETEDNLRLKIENHHLTMQSLQYESLKDRMEETRRAKHDLRQHLAFIGICIEEQNWNKLRDYLSDYMRILPSDTPISFCSHYAVNSVISYYAQLAEEKQIKFSAQLNIPSEINIADPDLIVVFGNLLENAYDACKTQERNHNFIVIKGGLQNVNTFVLTIDNSCETELSIAEDIGIYSTKHPGIGTGSLSVKNIAQRYKGIATFDVKEGVFHASVLLHL